MKILLLFAMLSHLGSIQVPVRSRVELFKGSGEWVPVAVEKTLTPARTAIIVCDMWDKHWCGGASQRVAELAPRVDSFLKQARAAGMLIIHAPSETMPFYENAPQRKLMLALAVTPKPQLREITAPPLPIDDSDGGCDTPDKFYKAWSREISSIEIAPQDAISDNGDEVYRLLKLRGIENLLVLGVHTNMCILNRSFAIKNMTKLGVRCILVRDLTDSMYNPADRPFVPHDSGTELVVEHIEKYWAPSLTSTDLLRALHH